MGEIGRELALRNVTMTPRIAAQPRFNAPGDFEEMRMKPENSL